MKKSIEANIDETAEDSDSKNFNEQKSLIWRRSSS